MLKRLTAAQVRALPVGATRLYVQHLHPGRTDWYVLWEGEEDVEVHHYKTNYAGGKKQKTPITSAEVDSEHATAVYTIRITPQVSDAYNDLSDSDFDSGSLQFDSHRMEMYAEWGEGPELVQKDQRNPRALGIQ